MRIVPKPIRKWLARLRGREDGWHLQNLRGVIHVGANTGQERDIYAAHNLNVLWIEPIPSVFEELMANIAPYQHQKAVRALVSDKTGEKTTLHIASNNGGSSSILPFKEHQDIWPDITYIDSICIESEILPDVLARAGHRIDSYDGLILDTQGSELMILRGAEHFLEKFRIIEIEVADFEPYKGCCTVNEVSTFMRDHGFLEAHRMVVARRKGGGRYYEIIYRNASLV